MKRIVMKRIAGLQEQLSKIKNDPKEYSDPRIVAQLPFTSVTQIPSRFRNTFSYMGRGERKIAVLGGMTTVRGLFCIAMLNL